MRAGSAGWLCLAAVFALTGVGVRAIARPAPAALERRPHVVAPADGRA
jgi:hypothetical protein